MRLPNTGSWSAERRHTVEGIALLGIGQDLQALGQWEEARAAYKSAASSDNESKLKNAEFKYTLAERKYDKYRKFTR